MDTSNFVCSGAIAKTIFIVNIMGARDKTNNENVCIGELELE